MVCACSVGGVWVSVIASGPSRRRAVDVAVAPARRTATADEQAPEAEGNEGRKKEPGGVVQDQLDTADRCRARQHAVTGRLAARVPARAGRGQTAEPDDDGTEALVAAATRADLRTRRGARDRRPPAPLLAEPVPDFGVVLAEDPGLVPLGDTGSDAMSLSMAVIAVPYMLSGSGA